MTGASSAPLPHLPLEPLADAPARLRALAASAARQTAASDYESEPWDGARDGAFSVLIVGAGQAGLATAHGLRRTGIGGVLVVDAAAEGTAGPWARYARMRTLRTPKNIKWPTWGVPAASPRAWFDARYGEEAWERIEFFPTHDWHAFLEWYRLTLSVPVRFRTTVARIRGGSDSQPFEVDLVVPEGTMTVRAHRIVLATGLEGAGGRNVPERLFDGIPADRFAHTHDDIDFAALAGLRVGVLGGGTGAFDNAATALEHGAASAVVHLRRPAMPTVSPYRWMEFPGVIEHYHSFTDAQKWAFNVHLTRIDQPATQNAVWRAFAFAEFSFRCSSPWASARWTGDEVVVQTPQGEERYDFVIAATGIAVDLARRPELAGLADDAVLWRDRMPAHEVEAAPGLGAYPYLDDAFGLQSDDPVRLAVLRRIHLFNHGARLSTGVLSHQISGLHGGVHRLVDGIARAVFRERSSELLAEFLAYDTPAGVELGPRRDRVASAEATRA